MNFIPLQVKLKDHLVLVLAKPSRSQTVCSNIAEGYRKRQYPAHFVSKISDADMENSETQVWIDFAFSCNYIDKNIKQGLENKTIEIGRLLNHMIENPEKYQKKSK